MLFVSLKVLPIPNESSITSASFYGFVVGGWTLMMSIRMVQPAPPMFVTTYLQTVKSYCFNLGKGRVR